MAGEGRSKNRVSGGTTGLDSYVCSAGDRAALSRVDNLYKKVGHVQVWGIACRESDVNGPLEIIWVIRKVADLSETRCQVI